MGSFSNTIPYSDPGSLHGAVREHLTVLRNIQADAFRSVSQKQDTGQDAQAISGANVDNVHSQTATVDQAARTFNTKTSTISPVTATNAHAADFNFNYLQHYLTGSEAADLLARGAANVLQDQGADQSAFAKLNNFSGTQSDALNDLDQSADVTQLFYVDLSATVNAQTSADDQADAFHQARFRTIDALASNHSSQAIFATNQLQGKPEDPVSQVAVADGADASNALTQAGQIDQGMIAGGITSDLQAAFDLSRTESATLTPRSADLAATVVDDSAISSSQANQGQAAVQSAAGGVDENGNVTENGGTAMNEGSASLIDGEDAFVRNRIEILI